MQPHSGHLDVGCERGPLGPFRPWKRRRAHQACRDRADAAGGIRGSPVGEVIGRRAFSSESVRSSTHDGTNVVAPSRYPMVVTDASSLLVDGKVAKSCLIRRSRPKGGRSPRSRGLGPPGAPGCVRGRERLPMRLLHDRHGAHRRRVAAAPEPGRRRDPARPNREPLPLHGLRGDRRGRPARRRRRAARAARCPSHLRNPERTVMDDRHSILAGRDLDPPRMRAGVPDPHRRRPRGHAPRTDVREHGPASQQGRSAPVHAYEIWIDEADFFSVQMKRPYRALFEARLPGMLRAPREVSTYEPIRADYVGPTTAGPNWAADDGGRP